MSRPEGEIDAIYLAPEVYEGTPAQCTGPCQFVFPPRPLGSTTTISLQPYTTSIQLKPGVTTTLTIKPSPIVTDSIEYYNVNVTSNQGTTKITPIASLTIIPITTTITLEGGETQVRTLTLPPWPAISGIPTGGQGSGEDNPTRTGGSTPIATRPPKTRVTTEKSVIPLPPLTQRPFPTFPGMPTTQTDTQPTQTWPPEWEIIPVESDVPDEGDDDDDDHDFFYVSCKLWFFSMCIDWPDFGVKIHGWKWNLPKGVHGPFPPPIPRIKLPPGVEFKGTLPVWPALTRAPDGTFTPPPKPANCEPAEASFCLTTSAFATTVTKGVTKTTATQVKSTCATVTGCNLQDVEETKTENACHLTRRDIESTNLAEATGVPSLHKRAQPDWCQETNGNDMVLILYDRTSSDQRDAVIAALDERDTELKKESKPCGYHEVRSNELKFTAFFFVNNVGPESNLFLSAYANNVSTKPSRQNHTRRFMSSADENNTISSWAIGWTPRLLLSQRQSETSESRP